MSLPLPSSYSSTGVPSGVLPKFVTFTLRTFVGSRPAAGAARLPRRLNAPRKGTAHPAAVLFLFINKSPVWLPIRLQESGITQDVVWKKGTARPRPLVLRMAIVTCRASKINRADPGNPGQEIRR